MKIVKPNYLTQNDWELLTKKYKNMHRVIKKLNKNYPVQYLIGNVNFYGYEIIVNKNVLIPRFETETLVEKTIDYIKQNNLIEGNVLEIGTGSACISIALKKELNGLKITSIDKSPKALKVAKKNIKNNTVNINLLKQNIFKYQISDRFDVLISNPPYISEDEIIDEKCKYEPSMALYANNKGLAFYENILKISHNIMNKKSILASEIGYKQGAYLEKLAKKYYKKAKISIETDLSGKDRYLFIINE